MYIRAILFMMTLCLSCASWAQTVDVEIEKIVYTQEKNITFHIKCASEQDLEITVFTDGNMALQQKSTLLPGDTPFELTTELLPSGKYFILITGNGIHIEKEFQLKH